QVQMFGGLLGAVWLLTQMLVPRSWQLNPPPLPVALLLVRWLPLVPGWKLMPICWLFVILFARACTALGAVDDTSMPLLPAPLIWLPVRLMSWAVSRMAMPLKFGFVMM